MQFKNGLWDQLLKGNRIKSKTFCICSDGDSRIRIYLNTTVYHVTQQIDVRCLVKQ